MKYITVLLLFLLNISVNAQSKYDHIEFSIRAGLPETRTFIPEDYTFSSGPLFNRPEGVSNVRSVLSGEISVNWVKRSYEYRTRWAMGLKAGIIPIRTNWFPSSDDSFYTLPIDDTSKMYGDKFSAGSYLFTGLTGGLRSRLITIGSTWLDLVVDLGLVYGLYDPGNRTYRLFDDTNSRTVDIFQISEDINPKNVSSGDVFIDFRMSYMFNFRIKERNVGTGVSITASSHNAIRSSIEYFGKNETVIARMSMQHVIYALELKYDLVR